MVLPSLNIFIIPPVRLFENANLLFHSVIPAKAGIQYSSQLLKTWIPDQVGNDNFRTASNLDKGLYPSGKPRSGIRVSLGFSFYF
jgi:hypothetical protein